jgi:hypothetical protein
MKSRFVLPSLLALAACNSQPPALTQTEYCNRYAQDVCAGVSPACLMTTANCMAYQLDQCSGQAQVNAGKDFLPPNAEAYLSLVSVAYGKVGQGDVITAKDYQAMEQARSRVYRGTVQANGPCANDAECLDGLTCDVAKFHCGTTKLVDPGAGCANIGETCREHFFCSNAGGIYVCTSKVGLGGACADASPPNPAIPCLENLRCSAGFCAMQLDFGQACADDQDCSSGFCEPYVGLCAKDVRFANGNPDCLAVGGT